MFYVNADFNRSGVKKHCGRKFINLHFYSFGHLGLTENSGRLHDAVYLMKMFVLDLTSFLQFNF